MSGPGEPTRPDPDALLARITSDAGTGSRGRLRVYVGMAPGVGKTYAALEEAHRRRERGTDIVVGFVEPHGRPLTAALLDGLEVVPRQRLEHSGVAVEELDTDALIARHPHIAIIDELAHTNAPGSPHEKRWQDVELIRDAGIDVISTLNVQHLESLADAVETITGAPVRERLPDAILDGADEIELVDMSPRALRARMRHGNVYPPEQTAIALERFFTEPNLTALRELSLRRVAQQVDTQLQRIVPAVPGQQPWPVTERVMVLLDGSPGNRDAVRRAASIAAGLRGQFLAAMIETPDANAVPHRVQQALREAMDDAVDLGATIVRAEASGTWDGLIRLATERQVTHLVATRPGVTALDRALGRDPIDRLLGALPGVDLHLVPAHAHA
ncbi:MAG: sensor histidine kinase KdpD [Candidatus Limnocylindrales bacterium]